MSVLGYEFHLGPEPAKPEPIDFTLGAVEVSRRQRLWADSILNAARYEDAWAVLTTKPNGDVLLFDISPERILEATSWGGRVHLLLAREASERKPGEIDRLCEVMHDAYEKAAAGNGWGTQQASRKPWADVPEANKATMRAAVGALLAAQ